MSQFSQHTETVTVPAGGLAYRVWDKPYHTPYKNYTIFVTGNVADATKLSAEVFIGGYFTDGTNKVKAWSSDVTTHIGGVSQAGAAAVGTAIVYVAKAVYSNAGLLPANALSLPSPMSVDGVPTVVEFKNTNAVDVTFQVTYICETLGTLV